MCKNEREGYLSLSYEKWIETCVEENTYAFVIEIKTDEQLEKVENVFRRLYPNVSRIKKLLLKEDDRYTGYIIKCRFNSYILAGKDIEIILKRELKDEKHFNITRVQEYQASGNATVLAHPTGCPWNIHSSF